MAPTIVLITGASRGIGRGLLQLYLSKPNHTIIAANRNITNSNSNALLELPKAPGTSLILVKIDLVSATDAADAVKELASRGIDHLDILIANAAVAFIWPRVSEVKTEDIQKHVEPNIYGNVRLYQAMLPLLKKAENPMWVSMGSTAGMITVSVRRHDHLCVCVWNVQVADTVDQDMIPFSNAAYGPTKAVLHWLTKAMQIEEPNLNAFSVHPGWVNTAMGDEAAASFEKLGFDSNSYMIGLDESVNGLIKVIDAATKETHSGKLFQWDGTQLNY